MDFADSDRSLFQPVPLLFSSQMLRATRAMMRQTTPLGSVAGTMMDFPLTYVMILYLGPPKTILRRAVSISVSASIACRATHTHHIYTLASLYPRPVLPHCPHPSPCCVHLCVCVHPCRATHTHHVPTRSHYSLPSTRFASQSLPPLFPSSPA